MRFIIDLRMNGYETEQEERQACISFIDSALNVGINYAEVLATIEEITAEKIFDVLAPKSRDDAAIPVTREDLQKAIDKLVA